MAMYSPALDRPCAEVARTDLTRIMRDVANASPTTERDHEILRGKQALLAAADPIGRLVDATINARLALLEKYGSDALRAHGAPWVDDVSY